MNRFTSSTGTDRQSRTHHSISFSPSLHLLIFLNSKPLPFPFLAAASAQNMGPIVNGDISALPYASQYLINVCMQCSCWCQGGGAHSQSSCWCRGRAVKKRRDSQQHTCTVQLIQQLLVQGAVRYAATACSWNGATVCAAKGTHQTLPQLSSHSHSSSSPKLLPFPFVQTSHVTPEQSGLNLSHIRPPPSSFMALPLPTSPSPHADKPRDT